MLIEYPDLGNCVSDLPNYSFIPGNITDVPMIDKLFEHEIRIVVDFAAESRVYQSILETHIFVKTNSKGTHVLLGTT